MKILIVTALILTLGVSCKTTADKEEGHIVPPQRIIEHAIKFATSLVIEERKDQSEAVKNILHAVEEIEVLVAEDCLSYYCLSEGLRYFLDEKLKLAPHQRLAVKALLDLVRGEVRQRIEANQNLSDRSARILEVARWVKEAAELYNEIKE